MLKTSDAKQRRITLARFAARAALKPPLAYLNSTSGSRSSKSETRNPKYETNPKQQTQMLKTVPPGEFRTLEHSVFEFVSDFGFRVSDLCQLRKVVPPRCAQPPRPANFALAFRPRVAFPIRVRRYSAAVGSNMNHTRLSAARVRQIMAGAHQTRVLVIGDAMLDHFIRGSVGRISPEAPVRVLDFEGESFMPGGAANVARNLTALRAPTELLGAVGRDRLGEQLG